MSFTQKILGGLFWGQLGMSMRSFLCFLISIFIARSLGASDFGIYSALVSLIAILLRFTDMGVYSVFNNYLPHFSSTEQHGKSSYLIRRMLQLKALFFFFISLALYGTIDLIAEVIGEPEVENYVLLLIFWFLVRGFADIFVYIVMSRMEMKYYSFVEITTSIIQFLGVWYLMQTGMDISGLIVVLIFIYSLQLIAYFYGSRHSFMTDPERTKLKPIAKYALIVWLSALMEYFLNNDIDIYMILYFLHDPALAGYYSVAYLLAFTGGGLFRTAIGTLSLTILSESNTTNGIEGMKRSSIFLYKLSVILAGPILVFMLFQSENIIHGLYSSEYNPAADLLAIFSFFFLISIFLGRGPIITVLLPLNKENWVLYLKGSGGLLNLILNIFLIPIYGVMGAVLATGLSIVILATVELIVVNRLVKLEIPGVFLFKSLVAMLIPASLTLLLGDMGLIPLIIVGAVYMFIVIKFTFILSPLNTKELDTLAEFSPKITSTMKALRFIEAKTTIPHRVTLDDTDKSTVRRSIPHKKKVLIFSDIGRRDIFPAIRELSHNKNIELFLGIQNESFSKRLLFGNYKKIKVDFSSEKNLISSLLKIKEKIGDYYILPNTDPFLRIISKNKEDLEESGIFCKTIDLHTFNLVSNKLSFADLCEKHHLRYPKELSGLPETFSKRFVIKPKKKSDKKDVLGVPYLVLSEKCLTKIKERKLNLREHFFQEYIDGPSYYYCAFYTNGVKEFSYSQINLHQQPNGGSIIKAAPCSLDIEVTNKIDTMYASINWNGLMMFELKEEQESGKLYAIECNPRMWGPIQLCIDNGYDFINPLVDEKPRHCQELSGKSGYIWISGYLSGFFDKLLNGGKFQFHKMQPKNKIQYKDIWLRKDTWFYFFYEPISIVLHWLKQLFRFK